MCSMWSECIQDRSIYCWADVSMKARMPILKEHRSELQVVFVKKPVDADAVLAKVRQLLGSPPSPSSIR
jgi:hypothetical protein